MAASIGTSAIIVESLADDATFLIEALDRMATVFTKIEKDLSVRQQLGELPFLQYAPEPQMAAHFFLIFEELISDLSKGAMSDQEKFHFWSEKFICALGLKSVQTGITVPAVRIMHP